MLAPRKTLWSTPQVAIDMAIYLASITKDDIVYDIGCGEGNFLIRCCQATGAKCIGVEIDEVRADKARDNIKSAGLSPDQASVITANALEVDYSDATVFFLYLVSRGLRIIYPLVTQRQEKEYLTTSRPLRVVTYMEPFPIEGLRPLQIAKAQPKHQPGAAWPLYLYHFRREERREEELR